MAIAILYWLTLALVLAVILALAGYLSAVAWALLGARRNVARLADGLEAVADATAGVGDPVHALAATVPRIADSFEAVDRELARCADSFRR